MKVLTVRLADDLVDRIEATIARRNLARARPRASQAGIIREGIVKLLDAEGNQEIETRCTKDA